MKTRFCTYDCSFFPRNFTLQEAIPVSLVSQQLPMFFLSNIVHIFRLTLYSWRYVSLKSGVNFCDTRYLDNKQTNKK